MVQLRGEIEGHEGPFDLTASLQKLDEMVRAAIVAKGGDPEAGIVTLTFTDLVSSPEQPFDSSEARASDIALHVAKELKWIVEIPPDDLNG